MKNDLISRSPNTPQGRIYGRLHGLPLPFGTAQHFMKMQHVGNMKGKKGWRSPPLSKNGPHIHTL
ncbi:hypothetical protein HanIR_Chr15g0762151 [Helianthus annuus]|nr:hypothetical protein HanIR_Chr15g0762151 [Helianthus annuus]